MYGQKETEKPSVTAPPPPGMASGKLRRGPLEAAQNQGQFKREGQVPKQSTQGQETTSYFSYYRAGDNLKHQTSKVLCWALLIWKTQ